MAKLGLTRNKKSPRADELSQLKDELRRVAEQLESHKRELAEATEQQTATSEILRVIASSPTDVQPVLDTIAENAARVCGSYDAVIRLVEGSVLRLAAHYGPVEPGFGLEQPLTRGLVSGRAVIDRQTIHIHDLLAESETEFAESRTQVRRFGHRTMLATPLLREGAPIGAILIRRLEVCPFTEKQIALLKTFADQAGIAIEIVRQHPLAPDRGSITGRVALERRTVQIEDVLTDPDYRLQEQQRIEGYRSLLGVPLLRDGIVIGVFVLWRNRVDRFTAKQIDLVTTFADQAVIAIENVRLFKELQERNAELREALEHQTATSEVLGIISRSPTDVQPVLDAIVESAARVCGIDDLGLRLREGND